MIYYCPSVQDGIQRRLSAAITQSVGDVAEKLLHLFKGHLICFEHTAQIEAAVLVVNIQRIRICIDREGLGGQALE